MLHLFKINYFPEIIFLLQVNKLKEAWSLANNEKEKRKNALNDNLDAWKYFEDKRQECARVLDTADAELKTLKKNFNMERAPVEHSEKMMNAARLRSEIEELFNETEGAFKTLTNFAPEVTTDQPLQL